MKTPGLEQGRAIQGALNELLASCEEMRRLWHSEDAEVANISNSET